MSITRNILATIGAVTVAVHVVKGFNKYLRKPLAELITEAVDDERERRENRAFGRENCRAPTDKEREDIAADKAGTSQQV